MVFLPGMSALVAGAGSRRPRPTRRCSPAPASAGPEAAALGIVDAVAPADGVVEAAVERAAPPRRQGPRDRRRDQARPLCRHRREAESPDRGLTAWRGEQPLTRLEAIVLGLLIERPAHGYELKARLGPGLPRERLVNDGVLYPLLARLERRGLAAVEEREIGGRLPEGLLGSRAGRRGVRRVARRGSRRGRRGRLRDLHRPPDGQAPVRVADERRAVRAEGRRACSPPPAPGSRHSIACRRPAPAAERQRRWGRRCSPSGAPASSALIEQLEGLGAARRPRAAG